MTSIYSLCKNLLFIREPLVSNAAETIAVLNQEAAFAVSADRPPGFAEHLQKQKGIKIRGIKYVRDMKFGIYAAI